MEKISFSLKLFSGHFYRHSFIKTVRGPSLYAFILARSRLGVLPVIFHKFATELWPLQHRKRYSAELKADSLTILVAFDDILICRCPA